jgi:hypothetical protein
MTADTGSPWFLHYPESTDDVRPYEDIQTLAENSHDALNAVTGAAWTVYTPALSSSGGLQPVIGNGSIVGEWRRETGGNIVDVTWLLTVGSTTNLGAGALFVGAPVNAHANAVAQNRGTAYSLDTGVKEWAGVLKWEDATKWAIPIADVGVITPASNIPHAYTTGDKISGTCRYRPA